MSLAAGQMTDGVYLNGGQIELTTTWTAMAGYEHSWTPNLKSSFTAGYSSVEYSDAAKAMFATRVCAAGTQGISGGTMPAFCDPDWQFLQGGIRTMWTVNPGFFLGVDVFYTQVWTAFKARVRRRERQRQRNDVIPIIGARPTGTYTLDDQHSVGAVFRAQRNFNAGD